MEKLGEVISDILDTIRSDNGTIRVGLMGSSEERVPTDMHYRIPKVGVLTDYDIGNYEILALGDGDKGDQFDLIDTDLLLKTLVANHDRSLALQAIASEDVNDQVGTDNEIYYTSQAMAVLMVFHGGMDDSRTPEFTMVDDPGAVSKDIIATVEEVLMHLQNALLLIVAGAASWYVSNHTNGDTTGYLRGASRNAVNVLGWNYPQAFSKTDQSQITLREKAKRITTIFYQLVHPFSKKNAVFMTYDFFPERFIVRYPGFKFPFAFDKDYYINIRVNKMSLPAGTRRLALIAAGIAGMVESGYIVFSQYVSSVGTVIKYTGKILSRPFAYHVGARYLYAKTGIQTANFEQKSTLLEGMLKEISYHLAYVTLGTTLSESPIMSSMITRALGDAGAYSLPFKAYAESLAAVVSVDAIKWVLSSRTIQAANFGDIKQTMEDRLATATTDEEKSIIVAEAKSEVSSVIEYITVSVTDLLSALNKDMNVEEGNE